MQDFVFPLPLATDQLSHSVSDSDSNYLIHMEKEDKSQDKGNYGIENSPFLQGPEQAMASGLPSRLLSLQDSLDPSYQLSVGNSLVWTLPLYSAQWT